MLRTEIRALESTPETKWDAQCDKACLHEVLASWPGVDLGLGEPGGDGTS